MVFAFISSHLRRLHHSEKGQTLTEYALILVLIAVVAFVAVGPLGARIKEIFEEMTGGLTS